MTGQAGPDRSEAAIVEYLSQAGLDYQVRSSAWDRGDPQRGPHGRHYVVALPGTAKLVTNVSLTIGTTSVIVNAFVCRAPAEDHVSVYRVILRRNPRLYGVAFGLDRLGDIYLTGHIPHAAVDEAELDRVLGVVLGESDGMFNQLVRIGFRSAIERERAWRERQGLDATNLAALARGPHQDQSHHDQG
jgi:hypothetical protein